MTEGGSFGLAAFAAALLFGGLIVERAMIRFRVRGYFTAGLPLLPPPVPIQEAPAGAGSTAAVRWEVMDDLVLFWAGGPSRGGGPGGGGPAPMLLHGAIRLIRGHDRIHLAVRWSPPWSPLLAAAWLAALGLVRGEGTVTVAIAAVMVVGVTWLYRHAAVRAAAELRWAFVQGHGR